MPEQFEDKEHDATPHKLQQSQERGEGAKSQDLTSAVLLLGGCLALLWSGGQIVQFGMGLIRKQLSGEAWLRLDPQSAVSIWWSILPELSTAMLPLMLTTFLLALASGFMQVGFHFLPDKVAPDFTRIDPLGKLQQMASLSNVVRLAFGLIKIAIVAAVAYASIASEWDTLLELASLSVGEIAVFTADVLLWTTIRVAVALFILAILDYGFQRWRWEQDLRMTTQEVREEAKELQGNPEMMARRKSVQRQLALNRVSTAIPRAEAVVTNPTELAIAIEYDEKTMKAPIVSAKGAGVVAKRIRELALKHGVPVLEKKPLAQALYKNVEVGQPVPQELYAAVAEVLHYVYRLKGKPLPQAG